MLEEEIICKVSVEIITFNNYIKEELSKMAKHSGINVIHYDGYIVMFDKVNYMQLLHTC